MDSSVLSRNEVFSKMETGKPYASYAKTILGKVMVTVWDSAMEKPTEVILEGNPKKKEASSIVSVWSEKENSVFKRMNQNHFKKGVIIPYTIPDDVIEEKTIEQSTDEELEAIVNLKYLALVNKLNKVETVPVLSRMLAIAKELDKSAGITGAIEKRISELQVAEFAPKTPIKVEED